MRIVAATCVYMYSLPYWSATNLALSLAASSLAFSFSCLCCSIRACCSFLRIISSSTLACRSASRTRLRSCRKSRREWTCCENYLWKISIRMDNCLLVSPAQPHLWPASPPVSSVCPPAAHWAVAHTHLTWPGHRASYFGLQECWWKQFHSPVQTDKHMQCVKLQINMNAYINSEWWGIRLPVCSFNMPSIVCIC